MNKDVMFSSATDLWETPQSFFDALNEEFGFETDVCALPENAKCARYFTPEDNGLAQTWTGVCWCNPPYGREIGKWRARRMATKRVCDRCGAEINPTSSATYVNVRSAFHEKSPDIELCCSCAMQIKEWLKPRVEEGKKDG